MTEESAYITDYDLPQFSPAHLSPDQVVIHRKLSPKSDEEEKQAVIIPVPVVVVQPPSKRDLPAYRPKMNNSKKVLNFVDKQVRKELFLAIKNGNIQLLTNFV